MSFEVTVDPGEFSVNSSGSVTGPIWFTVDGRSFPDEHWLDFIEPALTSWVREAFSLALGIEGTARLNFMDGPYVASFHLGDRLTVHGHFVGNGVNWEFQTDKKEFAQALINVVQQLAQGYRSQGLEADEWERYIIALGTKGVGD